MPAVRSTADKHRGDGVLTESDLITADRDFLIAIIAQLQATVLEQQRVIERLEWTRRIADGQQGFLAAKRFQQAGEVAALPQLGMCKAMVPTRVSQVRLR